MEEKRLIDADDLLIAFGNALNNATLKIGYHKGTDDGPA